MGMVIPFPRSRSLTTKEAHGSRAHVVRLPTSLAARTAGAGSGGGQFLAKTKLHAG